MLPNAAAGVPGNTGGRAVAAGADAGAAAGFCAAACTLIAATSTSATRYFDRDMENSLRTFSADPDLILTAAAVQICDYVKL